MTSEEEFDKATELFENMYREKAYVDVEGQHIIIDFGNVMLEVNLWSGSMWVHENGETVIEHTTRY